MVRFFIIIFAPFVLTWTAITTFAREMKQAVIFTYYEVCIEIDAIKHHWKTNSLERNDDEQ